mmetsp:Transcript_11614/g.19777  ORF Transcript_11614/g.19777 Transcript_11614/m.19777 type:complete len:136 (+) Transcript_11614:61-468(+)|eukprot:CAMPEP_0184644864 /NCGR_PEP_ID=MMETSP0308-20130426/1488_1 /TAXON_ID=38269 /ORGANISM="Gloeochaete witrockiana, Strain SAG 46.84" /LENGTH=135 /DNA_ID=CAMNT_0027073593 /DNA_START=87 /DNA_END=494 /DNA_ORIENTATION=-
MASAALKKPVFLKVDQLKPGGTGLNLVVKCVSCNIVVDRQRPDGSRIRIAECVVADETGCITLSARNAQIDAIKMTGQPTLVIRNGRIEMFQGFMRLMVDKWGIIQAADTPATFEANTQNNVSAIEYELVNVHDQ